MVMEVEDQEEESVLIPVSDNFGNQIVEENGFVVCYNTQEHQIEVHSSQSKSTYKNTSSNIEMNESSSAGFWTDSETFALLTAYEKFIGDFTHAKKRRDVWNKISNELYELGITKSAVVCERKWFNLLRTYKKTGSSKSGPTKFKYFERLTELLGNNGSSNKVHTTAQALNIGIDSDIKTFESTNEQAKKKYLVNQGYFKYKKEYMKEKLDNYKDHLQQKKVRDIKRLELEERKVKALEKIAANFEKQLNKK